MKTAKFNYRIIQTDDGSVSLYSHDYQEATHSPAGAYQETIHNYIEGCSIRSKAIAARQSKRPLVILEIGLGAGFGVAVTWQILRNWWQSLKNPKEYLDVHFISTEQDPLLIDYCQHHWGDQWPIGEKSSVAGLSFHLDILLGDARQTVLGIGQTVEAIYQDPFSLPKNPELWTKEWFLALKKISGPSTVLATYSAHPDARRAMQAAGWRIESMPGFASKRAATRAFFC